MKIRTGRLFSVLMTSLLFSMPGIAQQNTLRQDNPNRYTTYENVITMPAGRVMGSGHAVDVDSQGNIWVFERCGQNSCDNSELDPVLKFSPEGELLDSFGAGMFVFPHGIVVDEDDNLWIGGENVLCISIHIF